MQTLFHDGGFGLHTRSLKYGKLVTGELLSVRSGLIRRCKSQFLTLPWGVEVILGLNGYVWVGKCRSAVDAQHLHDIYSSKLVDVTHAERRAVVNTRNAIFMLNSKSMLIDEDSIIETYTTLIS